MSIFHVENGLFGLPKVQEAYNILFFLFLTKNSILKIFGSMDVKITPDVLKSSSDHVFNELIEN